ncbi:MAG TPA: DNA-processing protein DprA [Candidatus Angelobacter sp.]|nr:DNA-processing protein DprA [Candidatus Limnocylindria bacterium]HYL83944.1 DNA-processing protein DprA [Candidatus Angelobacter sp.]
MDSSQYLGWLALALTPGLGARMAGKLLQDFGSPEAIFSASLTALEARRLPAAVAQAIHTRQPLSDAAKELAMVQAAGCRLLTWDEPEYPRRLREIYDPPTLLYVRGNVELLGRHLISIVGARRPTPYGNQMAERLGRDLADRGLVVTSGLARGIDSSAHKGALSSPTGTTVGVLGCGIDVVYPKENKKIFAEMEKRGAIISEFPMGTFPAPQNFPIRNRIIAGMSLGVVVVEGAQYSGSLITARLAMEFGREVFGVPGNATQPSSFGPNQLIKQGAKLVTGWEDVVEELPTPVRAELLPVETASAEERAELVQQDLAPTERPLYELLSLDESRHVDELVELSGLTSSEVLAALFDLELKGVIRQLPGKQFLKVLL